MQRPTDTLSLLKEFSNGVSGPAELSAARIGGSCSGKSTNLGVLGLTIAGQPLDHLLYHFRLPWSGCEHAHVILGGESFVALNEGVRDMRYGRRAGPRLSSHRQPFGRIPQSGADARTALTTRYEALCAHYRMVPTRNNKGVAHENGAIESAHGHLKAAVRDAVLMRSSADFDDLGRYRAFIDEIVGRRNATRGKGIAADVNIYATFETCFAAARLACLTLCRRSPP